MATTNTHTAPTATLKAYEDKVASQLKEAKAKLGLIETKAKDAAAQGYATAINGLNAAKKNIDRKLLDLKKTNAAHVARAKVEIDADVAAFKSSVDEVAKKLK